MFSLQNIETSQTARKFVRKIKDKKFASRFLPQSTITTFRKMPMRGNSRKERKREDWNPKAKRCDTYHDVRFSSNPNQKLNCRSMEACWPNLWADTAVKRRTWDFPYPAMRKLVQALAAARERERGCTTVPQDLGFRIRRTTTTRQKTKSPRVDRRMRPDSRRKYVKWKFNEWIDERGRFWIFLAPIRSDASQHRMKDRLTSSLRHFQGYLFIYLFILQYRNFCEFFL
jgi:hypothetical protein